MRLRTVLPCPFPVPMRGPLPPSLFPSPPGTYPTVPLIPSIYLSISIFHIIQTREESDLIDRRKKSPFTHVRIKHRTECSIPYAVFYVLRSVHVLESIVLQGKFALCFQKKLSSTKQADSSYLLKVSENRDVTDTNLSLNDVLRYDSAVINVGGKMFA